MLLKKVGILMACLLLSILLVVVLYAIADVPNVRKNGFNREFKIPLFYPLRFIDLKSSSFDILGVGGDNVYLSNYKDGRDIVRASITLSDTSHIAIHIKDSIGKSLIAFGMDSQAVYLADKDKYVIHKAFLKDSTSESYRPGDLIFFSALLTGKSTLILRSNDTLAKQSILTKYIPKTSYIKQQRNSLQKQIDGYICTDGKLQYDPELDRIFYIYLYRNEFLCLDTNLNLIYKGKTVDTTTKAKVKIGSYRSGRFFTFSAPPVMINKRSCIAYSYLFIESGLLADNESRQVYGKSSVIDVYSTKNGNYTMSFHIPEFDGEKVSYFAIYKNKLFTIQGKYLVLYDFTPLRRYL